MATTVFSQVIAPIDSNVLPAATITNTAYAISATAIDNRPTVGSVISYDLADLRIALSGNPVLGAGGYLGVSIFPAIDGGTVNYASPNAAIAGPPSLMVKSYQSPNAATSEIVVTDIPIGPYSFKVHVYNWLGTSITVTSAQLQRRTMASW